MKGVIRIVCMLGNLLLDIGGVAEVTIVGMWSYLVNNENT
jgi:hypothetical protein